jgi:hypothetical protein
VELNYSLNFFKEKWGGRRRWRVVLRKEYFDMSTYRETLTQYITFKRGGEESVLSKSL